MEWLLDSLTESSVRHRTFSMERNFLGQQNSRKEKQPTLVRVRLNNFACGLLLIHIMKIHTIIFHLIDDSSVSKCTCIHCETFIISSFPHTTLPFSLVLSHFIKSKYSTLSFVFINYLFLDSYNEGLNTPDETRKSCCVNFREYTGDCLV